MARGLKTPMWIILIGLLGGVWVHGLIGLFVGPIVLSIGWQLLALWFRDESLKEGLLAQPANIKRDLA